MTRLFAAYALGLILVLNSCSSESGKPIQRASEQHLIVATVTDPLALDPRLVRDLSTVTVMHMLFEGLMRVNNQGKLEPAAAESVTISSDKKTYTFTLRNCKWCDGTTVTAQDFENTWKSILTPQFPAPNAYQLYPIKGAKLAKEGKLPLSDVGVKATSPNTLVVELEQPTPYFLEMTSCHFYFPVNSNMVRDEVNYDINHDLDEHEKKLEQQLIGNGPFNIAHWKHRDEISMVKNPLYHEHENVHLERVTLQVLDENTALQLFKAGDIDWVGSPLSTIPQDAVATLKKENKLSISPGAGTHWFRFNTGHEPFTNRNLRLAFSHALDRQSIVEHVTQGNQKPALGIVPPSFGFTGMHGYYDGDIENAKRHFEDALRELALTSETFPIVTLCYASGDRNHKIAQAVQQQWHKALGVTVALESCEGQVIFDKLNKGQYQISAGSWYADFADPANFLELFKERDSPTNNTFWHNPQFVQLLNTSAMESSEEKRMLLLMAAEKILLDEAPLAPLFHSSYNYMKNDSVQGVYFSELGYLDFSRANMKHPSHQGPAS